MLDKYEHDTRITLIAGFNNQESPPASPTTILRLHLLHLGLASLRRVVD